MKEKCKGCQISDKAVVILSIYIEEYVKNVTEKSMEILDKMNENCEIQGLRKQMRLDDKCIQKGINNINQENLLNLPGKQEGGKVKEKKRFGKHLQINELSMEVI
ncbi:MAG: hypothetical protein AYK22_05865 [Thermoplasmatales archaeon SG8-52-3]|nr:MAG: hypothetical protein AYK22_05865 [Thermoplasmatales archaeon SG8-52-3]